MKLSKKRITKALITYMYAGWHLYCSQTPEERFSRVKAHIFFTFSQSVHRGSYMIAHVLLNLLNKLGKSDKNGRLAEYFITFWQQVL